jgi:hypothetical protein
LAPENDDSDVARYLRIEERELEAGGLNWLYSERERLLGPVGVGVKLLLVQPEHAA